MAQYEYIFFVKKYACTKKYSALTKISYTLQNIIYNARSVQNNIYNMAVLIKISPKSEDMWKAYDGPTYIKNLIMRK